MNPEFVAQDCSGGGPACVAQAAASFLLFGDAATPNYPIIFLTSSTYVGGTLGSASNADTQCNAQIPAGVSGSFKALLVHYSVTTPIRRASVTAYVGDGQVDWVLKPNQYYMRPDATVIGKTNASALFTFPLENSFATSGRFWTGLQGNWTSALYPCNDGNSTSWGGNGTANTGDASALGATSITDIAIACPNARALLCVEQ